MVIGRYKAMSWRTLSHDGLIGHLAAETSASLIQWSAASLASDHTISNTTQPHNELNHITITSST